MNVDDWDVDKVVGLVGGGSAINGAYPVYFFYLHILILTLQTFTLGIQY